MRFKRFAALLLTLILLSGTCFAVGEDYGTFGDELTEEQYDFIYNPENYNMKFVPGVVVVALKKGLTKEDVDFSEIDYYYSYPATSGEDNLVLLMVLKSNTKPGVLSAIDALKDNPGVLYAEPNYDNWFFNTASTDAPTGRVPGNGDIDYDGKTTNSDLIILARYIVRLTSLTFNQVKRADLNGDGKINNTDLLILAKKIVGIR